MASYKHPSLADACLVHRKSKYGWAGKWSLKKYYIEPLVTSMVEQSKMHQIISLLIWLCIIKIIMFTIYNTRLTNVNLITML
jgi:hypothetical protein